MTIRRMQFYRNVLLIFTGVWICLTDGLNDSSACPGNAVYHYGTNKCFIVKNIGRLWSIEVHLVNQCQEYKGGEYGNITGRLASVDTSSEGFLRDYLKYLQVPDAVVVVDNYGIETQTIRDLKTKNYYDCNDNDIYDGKQYFLIMLAEAHGTPVNWKKTSCRYIGSTICQVESAGVVSEKSSCPSNVTVESVSDSEVIFNITPGITHSQVKIIFRAYKPCKNTKESMCGEQGTKYNTLFLTKPTTTTYLEFQPNTHFKAQFVIERFGGQHFDCNMTVDFKTLGAQEEDENCKGEVIGLSILLVCSLCVTVALAIIYCRLRKSTGQDNSGLSPVRLMMSLLKRDNRAQTTANTYSGSDVGTSKTPSEVGKAGMSQIKRSNSDFGEYTNVQVTAPNYDVANNEQDDHVYEM